MRVVFLCLMFFLLSHAAFALGISSAAFGEGGTIPARYTCADSDIAPPLAFKDVPAAAQSLALVVDDPDAPSGLWTHWILYNMPAKAAAAAGGTQGLNSFGDASYGGPCPPPGSGAHHYVFHLYALDTMITPASSSRQDIAAAMEGHVIAEASLTGLFARN